MTRFPALLLLSCLGVIPLNAQSADVISGRVYDDSSRVLVGAAVTITRGPDRLVQATTSDSTGQYSLRFEPGTGDYLVHVAYVGFKSRVGSN